MNARARVSQPESAGRLRALLATVLPLVAVALLALTPARALAAFTPPSLDGHVMDTAGKLSQAEILRLDRKLDAVRQKTGFAVVAFVVGDLQGETIEDVAYETFNAWKVGEKNLDNGVLLVIAPGERRTRIETGKGVGGALTDLQTNDILREVVGPLLRQDRFYDAVDQGTIAIADALIKGSPEGQTPRERSAGRPPDMVKVGLYAGGLLLVIVLAIVSPTFRSLLWVVVQMLFFFGGRGGGSGGHGGGSGYGGGGGRSGGGGSSDSY
ncbi:TPM domain-containing protein [Chondromyces apiculatus]|uniref:Beta-propeller domains of methanol dehydrogenase type n=1 Tax=Chondromyces apiculatus DSM 436 TaxID=1192034 RepID=A0A017T7W4_9BACT|nr:TPM domain-containing protein [Chondromyces apiculatus]EYF05363.1 Beta-propeller domains of methanol dehydrogenase type [Chondromyces apiculatus DSM 436]